MNNLYVNLLNCTKCIYINFGKFERLEDSYFTAKSRVCVCVYLRGSAAEINHYLIRFQFLIYC